MRLVALHAQQQFVGARAREFEKSLVDVADLFDIQRTERKRDRAALLLKHLQRFKNEQYRAVVDGKRRRIVVRHGKAELTPFEERELLGIEERPAHGRKKQIGMADAAVHETEHAQEPRPCIVAALQHLRTELVRFLLQFLAQRRYGIDIVVLLFAKEHQPAFLRAEEEHKPHHHRERGLVERRRRHARKELASGIKIGSVEALHEDFNSRHHLLAERVGYFLEMLERFVQQIRQTLLRRAHEATIAEEREEGAKRGILLKPEPGIPGCRAGKRAARSGVDEHPLLAVRDKSDSYLVGSAETRHLLDDRVLPVIGDIPRVGLRIRRQYLDEQRGLRVHVLEGVVRGKSSKPAFPSDAPFRSWRKIAIPELETVTQNRTDPCVVEGGEIGMSGFEGLHPFRVEVRKVAFGPLVKAIQPIGKRLVENRRGEEWSRNFNELKPVVVDGSLTAHWQHPMLWFQVQGRELPLGRSTSAGSSSAAR